MNANNSADFTVSLTLRAPRLRPTTTMADTVTQLQDQINSLCQLLCNYAGTLQRDALPVRRALNVVRGARELPRNLARYF